MHMYIYIYAYTYMYIYVHTHTHTHTHRRENVSSRDTSGADGSTRTLLRARYTKVTY